MQTIQWAHFVDHFTNSISHIVPCHGFFSYETNTTQQTAIHACHFKNISKKSVDNYLDTMCQFDPVFFKNNNDHDMDMVCLQQKIIPDEYQSFLIENQVADNIELYFKSENAPFRGISLIRSTKEGAFSVQDLRIIETCYALAKFNLPHSLNHIDTNIIDQTLPLQYNLTHKEQQVVELILKGKKNQDIADRMFVSLATIKTHIQHIFQKTMVSNRQELMLKMMS